MNDIAIYGAGGFGKEVHSIIKRINEIEGLWNVIGFIDDGIKENEIVDDIPVLGNLNFLQSYQKKLAVIIAIGNSQIVKKIASSLSNNKLWYPNIIDPTALIDDHYSLGIGNLCCAFSFLSNDVVIGNFNILNTRVTIGHDTRVGSFNIFNPNVQISGGVKIGNENFWGMNSSIVQYKSVGNNNTIGACSLIIKNISDNAMYFGIPATKHQKF